MQSMSVVVTSAQAQWVRRLDNLHLLTPLRIAAVLLAAVILTTLIARLVAKLTNRIVALPGSDRNRAQARRTALGTVLRSTLIGVVWATAVITVISELGVNIGAFVATATVVGGAIAFGAQTLVRDAIAGFFVIAEDQYGVGDVVDVGHATGSVERITLRSVQLRDGEGRVWYVPHGGVVRTANLSKAPQVLLDLDVARSTDLAKLHTVSERLTHQLATAPQLVDAFERPPTVVGLAEVRDDRMVYRVTAETKPGAQERVRREWRVISMQMFQAGEIEAPAAPTTVVHVGTAPAPESA